jgi:hypothetical protein
VQLLVHADDSAGERAQGTPPRLTIPITGPISRPGITSLAIAKIWFVAHRPSEIKSTVAARNTKKFGAIMAKEAWNQ